MFGRGAASAGSQPAEGALPPPPTETRPLFPSPSTALKRCGVGVIAGGPVLSKSQNQRLQQDVRRAALRTVRGKTRPFLQLEHEGRAVGTRGIISEGGVCFLKGAMTKPGSSSARVLLQEAKTAPVIIQKRERRGRLPK